MRMPPSPRDISISREIIFTVSQAEIWMEQLFRCCPTV
jgi:hypothetical protein